MSVIPEQARQNDPFFKLLYVLCRILPICSILIHDGIVSHDGIMVHDSIVGHGGA